MTDCAEQSEPAKAISQSGTGTGDSFSGGPFFQRTDWLSFGATTMIILVVYLRTIAPEVTLEYSGILSVSATYAGVPHPPGFPVWTIYSWLFVKLLPVSNIAWRVAVGSAVAAALACGLVALMVSRGGLLLIENRLAFPRWKPADQNLLRVACGFVAGMALGLSSTLWREAVTADAWALSVFLFAAMLCLLMRWMVSPERRRFLLGAVFVFSLLLTGNQELIVVTPALLLLAMLSERGLGRDLSLPIVLLAITDWVMSEFGGYPWFGSYYMNGNVWLLLAFLFVGVVAVIAIVRTRRFGSEWKWVTLCGLVFLLGLGCYFYLPIASMTNPPMNWGYPRTVEGFFHVITRGQYERPHPTDELGRFIGQVWTMIQETSGGFGWLYFPFAVLPFCLLRQTVRSARNWLLGLMAVIVCAGPLMVAALNPSADLANVQLVAPFFCPMYIVLAVGTGMGLMIVGGLVVKRGIQPEQNAQPVA